MNENIVFKQDDLILRVSKNYDRSKLNIDKWARYLDVLCQNREYQKEAIKSAIIFMASGQYENTEDLIIENYKKNENLRKKYTRVEEYIGQLQIRDKYFANIDLATGTGKSYVIYGIAQIMLAEGLVKRALVLCPSRTIEKGLKDKFMALSSDSNLRSAIPEDAIIANPRIIDANVTVKEGDICVENIHAVYSNTGSSIIDSFNGTGEDTIVLNDESHHIFNTIIGRDKKTQDIKKWKEFLTNRDYGFRYILGFTGTAYIDNEYFNDVIYRYSLKTAIESGIVKKIDYVQKDDSGNNPDIKFQKIYQNHLQNKLTYSKVKPLTIMITKDVNNAKILYEDFINFMKEYEGLTKENVEKKVLIVTSRPEHEKNVLMLDYVDDSDNSIEWIISVSMLTEGWDVKNVFQIVPWEDRAFNSKLLIAQVLGRGLRIPEKHSVPQPSVVVFNHDSWSKNIKSLVDEVLEIENKIITTVKFEGDRNKYNFTMRNIDYDKEEKEVSSSASIKPIDYSTSWNEGIKLKSQSIIDSKDTEYHSLTTGDVTYQNYNIKLRTNTVDEVVDKILREFRLRDWEGSILGLGDGTIYSKDNLPPREKIEEIIRKSMSKAGIIGDELVEENSIKIFTAFSTLFRKRNKTVVYKTRSANLFDVNTKDMKNDSASLSSFYSRASLFYSSNYSNEIENEEQLNLVEEFISNENYPRKAYKEINVYDFKTPLNMVIAQSEPERLFINELCKTENREKLDSWIKSRDMGFYKINYSYQVGSHTKTKEFNPDFIIKFTNNETTIFVVVEIKEDDDISDINKAKNKYAKSHFKTLNEKLLESNIKEYYKFYFLSPNSYTAFFEYLRDGRLTSMENVFTSDLEISLDEE
jgi:type III restriction enzyme